MTEDSKKDKKTKEGGPEPAAGAAAPKSDKPGPDPAKPDTKEPPKTEPVKPAAKEPPKTSAASAAGSKTSSPRRTKKKGSGAGLAWTLLVLVVIGVGGFFSWPLWSSYAIPYLEPYFPDIAKAPEENPKLAALDGRLASLEKLASERQADAGAIAALEQERERLRTELATVIGRVEELEKALGDVRRVAEAASLPAVAADASESLGQLMRRIAELEGRTDSLAGTTTKVDEISQRIGTLEASASAAGTSASAASAASAAVLAVNQLDAAVAGGGSFSAELQALKAMAGNDAELAAAVAALEPYAASGAPTVADLTNRFSAVAADIVRAEAALRGEGWMKQAVNRVTSLVSIRRTGARAAAAGGVEAAVARAEELLAGSDLAAAVDALSGLDGPAADAAAGWLKDAQSRLAVEKAVASLQVRAVALVSGSGQ